MNQSSAYDYLVKVCTTMKTSMDINLMYEKHCLVDPLT